MTGEYTRDDEAREMAWLERRAAELVERQRTAHERVACPKCGQPVGERCKRLSARHMARPSLKHSHRERLRADGIELR
jgi:hypothetical protein